MCSSDLKDLEPGKSVEGADWVGRDEAEKEVEASFARLRESGRHDAIATTVAPRHADLP